METSQESIKKNFLVKIDTRDNIELWYQPFTGACYQVSNENIKPTSKFIWNKYDRKVHQSRIVYYPVAG